MEGADSYHYRTHAGYIHLHPVRARLIQPRKGESVLDYPWSSMAGGWSLPPGQRPKWLAGEDGLARFDLLDTVAGRRRMVERLDRRAVEEDFNKCGMPVVPKELDARCSHLQRGWYWGSHGFAEKLSMRSAANVSQQLRRVKTANAQPRLVPGMHRFLEKAWAKEKR